MKVVIQEIGIPNRNGVIYPKEVVEEALKKVQEPLIGLFNDEAPSVELDLSKVSHSVSNLRIEDNALIGDIKILDTPMGRELQFLLDTVVFRPRGIGMVSSNGVVSDYKLLSVNAVYNGEAA